MKKTIIFSVFLLALFLRFFRLDLVPPGLFVDEASIGTNARSILETGKDEYGVPFPLFFRSLDDYKMPVYIYLCSLSVRVFGVNGFAVRFPAAVLGAFTVLVLIRLVLFLGHTKTAYLSGFLFAVSPWHLQFTHAGFEAGAGLLFFICGLYFILSSAFYRNGKSLYLGLLFMSLSMYAYHSFRVTAPLTFFCFVVFSVKNKVFLLKRIFVSILLFILVFIPITGVFSEGGFDRVRQTSIIGNMQANRGLGDYAGLFVNFMKNYTSYFSPVFFFVKGDGIGRHQLPGGGLTQLWTAPFLVIGFYVLLKNKFHKLKKIVLFLLFTSPIPAAMAFPSPHSLRSLPLVIPLIIIVSLGLNQILENTLTKTRMLIMVFLVLVICYSFSLYLHRYYIHYPNTNIVDWGGGYPKLVSALEKYKANYEYFAVEDKLRFLGEYLKFHNSRIKPVFIQPGWTKPGEWPSGKVIFVTHYINKGENMPSGKILEAIMLDNPNHDGFAQVWKLEK